jgi:hypothetical protein
LKIKPRKKAAGRATIAEVRTFIRHSAVTAD